jgi:hypothetical protein
LQEKIIKQENWQASGARIYISKVEGEFTQELEVWVVEKMAIFINILQPIFNKLG